MQLRLSSLLILLCSLFLVRQTSAGFTGDQWTALTAAINSLKQLNIDVRCAELAAQVPFLSPQSKDQIYDTCHQGKIRTEFLSGVPSNPMNPPLVTVPKGTKLFFPTMSVLKSLDLSRPTWFYHTPQDALTVATMMFSGRGVSFGGWPELWEVVTNEEIPLLAVQSGKDGFQEAIQKLPFTLLPKASLLRSKKQSQTRVLGQPASVALALAKDLDLCTAVKGWRNPANLNEVVLCPSALQTVTVKPAASLLKSLRQALHYDDLRTEYLQVEKYVEDNKIGPSDRKRIDAYNRLVVKYSAYFKDQLRDETLEELLAWLRTQPTPRNVFNDFFMAYTRQFRKLFPDRALVAERWTNDNGAFLLADLPIDLLQKIL